MAPALDQLLLSASFRPLSLLQEHPVQETFITLKVYLHEQWFLCRSVSRDNLQHTVKISYNLVARSRVTRSDTKRCFYNCDNGVAESWSVFENSNNAKEIGLEIYF
jgi:hypothetical protein